MSNKKKKITNEGTMLVKEWDEGKTKWYNIACACNDCDHPLSIWVEEDKTWLNEVGIKFDMKVTTNHWSEIIETDNIENEFLISLIHWTNDKLRRVREAWNILWKGYYETEGHFHIVDPERLDNLINILENGREIFEKNKERD